MADSPLLLLVPVISSLTSSGVPNLTAGLCSACSPSSKEEEDHNQHATTTILIAQRQSTAAEEPEIHQIVHMSVTEKEMRQEEGYEEEEEKERSREMLLEMSTIEEEKEEEIRQIEAGGGTTTLPPPSQRPATAGEEERKEIGDDSKNRPLLLLNANGTEPLPPIDLRQQTNAVTKTLTLSISNQGQASTSSSSSHQSTEKTILAVARERAQEKVDFVNGNFAAICGSSSSVPQLETAVSMAARIQQKNKPDAQRMAAISWREAEKYGVRMEVEQQQKKKQQQLMSNGTDKFIAILGDSLTANGVPHIIGLALLTSSSNEKEKERQQIFSWANNELIHQKHQQQKQKWFDASVGQQQQFIEEAEQREMEEEELHQKNAAADSAVEELFGGRVEKEKEEEPPRLLLETAPDWAAAGGQVWNREIAVQKQEQKQKSGETTTEQMLFINRAMGPTTSAASGSNRTAWFNSTPAPQQQLNTEKENAWPIQVQIIQQQQQFSQQQQQQEQQQQLSLISPVSSSSSQQQQQQPLNGRTPPATVGTRSPFGQLEALDEDWRLSPKTLSRIKRLKVVMEPENATVESKDAAVEVIHHHPVFVKDTSRYWYKPTISREEAIAMLKNKPPGTFVVRDSNSFPGAFGLALKVAQPPAGVTPTDGSELVRHFLIEPSSKGVRLKGCSNEPVFGTLAALVYQHSITPLALPYRLILPDYDPATGPEHINSNQALLERGAACNVTYLCSVDTESLTGPEAVRRSTAFAFELLLRRELRAVPVHFKVSSQGITLTDNTRSLFFRRHYPVNSVTFAGIDPESRVFDNNNVGQLPPTYVRQAPVFGFVARKNHSGALNGGSVENACHIFAELDPDQPASAVVRFVSNVMMPAARMHQQQQNAIAITH